MRIHKCWFCSANIYPGHGTTFVRNDSTIFRFCRSKCYKLFQKRLNPRKIRWTKIYRKVHNKELSSDPIYQLERRVNVPSIYDKETVVSTVEAIPKIVAIRQRREDSYVKNRILKAKEEQKEREIAFIGKHEHLLQEKTAEAAVKVQKKEREVEYN